MILQVVPLQGEGEKCLHRYQMAHGTEGKERGERQHSATSAE